MIILPHEEMIEKLENTRIKRMNLFGNLNQYMGSDSTNSNFTKDENRKPILILKELEQTAIHTPTQESYDTLMQIYECGNWKWNTEIYHIWQIYRKNSCIVANNNFQFGHIELIKKCNQKILTPKEFYEIQKPEITPKMIQEISQWFETNKPNRKSKRCILDLL